MTISWQIFYSESIMKINKVLSPQSPDSVEVIVRAYADEPVRLYAIGSSAGRVEVAGADKRYSIRYPRQWVYAFEQSAFNKLRNAYEEGNMSELKRLWNGSIRYAG